MYMYVEWKFRYRSYPTTSEQQEDSNSRGQVICYKFLFYLYSFEQDWNVLLINYSHSARHNDPTKNNVNNGTEGRFNVYNSYHNNDNTTKKRTNNKPALYIIYKLHQIDSAKRKS